MENLLQIIQRFGGFLLFFALELVCIFLMVNFDGRHRQIFFSSANRMTGGIYHSYDNVSKFFGLARRNTNLREDNARLWEENENLRRRVSRQRLLAGDSIPPTVNLPDSALEAFRFTSARVINNAVHGQNNTLTLDAGRLDGVEPHTGVIDGEGVVGIVTRVSRHFASVMSVLNRQSRVSAGIRSKSYFGTLTWDGRRTTILQLEAVPKHADIRTGDTVVTSGYSHMFPPGVPIGIIDSIWLDPGDNFFGIDVELINDLSRAKHVYICRNLYREELLELEEGTSDDR